MSIPNRAAVLTKLFRSLKKQYSPIAPAATRTVLEDLLFACLLEDNQYDAAEKAYAALAQGFFDWNEVRVSSVKELAEVASGLIDPDASARRLKRSLHGVFEATYQFDLEDMKKQNIGAAEKRLEKIPGTTMFVVAYVVQQALAGHSIPLDQGSLRSLYVLGAATEKEIASRKIPGLERAIPKKSGAEFGCLLHQLGAEITASPYSPKTRNALLNLAPDCKDRLPKRPTKVKEVPPKPKKKVALKQAPEKSAAKPAAKTAPPTKAAIKTATKKAVATKKSATKKAPVKKTAAKKTVTKKVVKRPAAKKTTKKKSSTKKTSTTKRITKRKPR